MAIAPEAKAQIVNNDSSPTSVDTKAYAVNSILISPPCEFRFGYKTIHDLIPDIVGNCIDDEAYIGLGDSNQHTTGGLMAWRKRDNWTAFTDGYRTWVNGPYGLQMRLNTDRFPWEFDDRNLPPGTPYGVGGGPTAPNETVKPTSVEIAKNTYNYGPGVSDNDKQLIQRGEDLAEKFYSSQGFILPSKYIVNVDNGNQSWTAGTGGDPITTTIHAASPLWQTRTSMARSQTAAHERFHSIQNGIVGPFIPGPFVITEGTAELLGYATMAANNLTSLDQIQRCYVGWLKNVGSKPISSVEQSWGQTNYPDLSAAFLYAQFLASQRGVLSFADYFNKLRAQEPSAAFSQTYGTTLSDSYGRFDIYLQGLRGDLSACKAIFA